jgi:hypothetical protein
MKKEECRRTLAHGGDLGIISSFIFPPSSFSMSLLAATVAAGFREQCLEF